MGFILDELHQADVIKIPLILRSANDTERLGATVRQFFNGLYSHKIGSNHTMGLSGTIGAGKSTFANALAGVQNSFNSVATDSDMPTYINASLEQKVNKANAWLSRKPTSVCQKTLAQDGLVISWADASHLEREEDNVVAQNRLEFIKKNPGFSFSNSLELVEHPECCQWRLEMDSFLDLIAPEEDEKDEDSVVEAFLYIDRALCNTPQFGALVKSCSDLLGDEFEGIILVETNEADVRL